MQPLDGLSNATDYADFERILSLTVSPELRISPWKSLKFSTLFQLLLLCLREEGPQTCRWDRLEG